MKIAIVHYWLIGMRGGEKVLESLCSMFPSADIFIVGFDGMTTGWYWDQDHDCTENCRNSLIMEKIYYKKIVSKHNIYEL